MKKNVTTSCSGVAKVPPRCSHRWVTITGMTSCSANSAAYGSQLPSLAVVRVGSVQACDARGGRNAARERVVTATALLECGAKENH